MGRDFWRRPPLFVLAQILALAAVLYGPPRASAVAAQLVDAVTGDVGSRADGSKEPEQDRALSAQVGKSLLLSGDSLGSLRNHGYRRQLEVEEAFEPVEGEYRTFVQLAHARFEARAGRPPTADDEDWKFDHVQLVRVPKAASTAVSVVARNLAGCLPHGPCCDFPGDPVGSCPAKGLKCERVTGCVGHWMGEEKVEMMANPAIFSLSNLRDVTDRIVSAFFYTAPHSPPCARKDVVDYNSCFRQMVHESSFQNIAARMFTGSFAYDGKQRLCLEAGPRCDFALTDVIKGACNLNFIAMTEAWSSSMLLLFETVPWMAPTAEYFPSFKSSEAGDHGRQLTMNLDVEMDVKASAGNLDKVTSNMDLDADSLDGKLTYRRFSRGLADMKGDVMGDTTRHNTGKRHEEGIAHITTPELMDLARQENAVDVALHEFVTAMFCNRLRVLGLIDHPLVVKELTAFEPLAERCYDAVKLSATLQRFQPMMPEGRDCRLYQLLSRDVFH